MKQELAPFLTELEGCRFCPMCKPAAEVANITQFESHTTRARAIFLWREASGFAPLTDRETEILYESTLDGISEAWCVSHYRVSEYTRAARKALVERDQVPDAVRAVVDAPVYEPCVPTSDTVLFVDTPAVTAAATNANGHDTDTGRSDAYSNALNLPPAWRADSGVSLYWLGADRAAKERLTRMIDALGGVVTVVAAGATEQFALTGMARELGIEFPTTLEVLPLATWLSRRTDLTARYERLHAFFHDSRAAMKLSREKAGDAAIQPSFDGPEEALGTGEVYDAPRVVLERAGYSLRFVRWQRSFTRTSGADDSLDLVYPELSDRLADARIRYLTEHGVRLVVTDSQAARDVLSRAAVRLGLETTVVWLPDAFLKD